MDIINWLIEHGEAWQVTLAEDGYDSYYPEYEEYFNKHETRHFSQQTLMIIMILLSKYHTEIFLTDDWMNLLEIISDNELEKIHNAINRSIIDGKGAVYILFTDDNNYQFGVEVAADLGLSFFNMPHATSKYVKALVDKAGLSMYLDKTYEE